MLFEFDDLSFKTEKFSFGTERHLLLKNAYNILHIARLSPSKTMKANLKYFENLNSEKVNVPHYSDVSIYSKLGSSIL